MFLIAKTAFFTMNSKIENVKLPLPNSTRKELRDFLRSKFSNFIFRRVGKVLVKPEDMLSVENFQACVSENGGVYINSEIIHPSEYNPDFFTSEQLEKNLEFKSKKFSLFTSPNKLRDNDRWGKTSIYCASMNYNQLDFLSNECTFEPLNLKELRSNTVLPRVGDLICMEVDIGSKGKPQAKWWFNCSDQFLHAWTLIMYDSCESFVKKDLYAHSFSGNRLQTNTFLKWSLSRKDNNISLDEDECRKRYYRLRTEYVSKKWVHLYCSLVLMARFGELPTVHNIPNNINEPEITKWDLPPYFVQTLLSKRTHFFESISESFHPEKYFDLEGTIFERKIIVEEKVTIDRPSIEGVEQQLNVVPVPTVDVCDEKEFPPLLESINIPRDEKPHSTLLPRVVAKEEQTSFIWNTNLNIGSWSDEADDEFPPLLKQSIIPEPSSITPVPQDEIHLDEKKEDLLQKEEVIVKQPEWFSKFEKIKILMEDENKQKFEKIREEMTRKLEEDLEKIRVQLQKDMELTLEKIQIAMQ